MKVEKSINIEASPEKAWTFVSDPDNVLKWYFPLQKFEYVGAQRKEVGARIDFEEKVAGRVIKLDCEVTEWKENEAFAFRMISGQSMKSYQERWTVNPTPEGCRFTFLEQGELPYGFLGKLLNPIAERGSGATIEKMLQKLKGLAEARSPN